MYTNKLYVLHIGIFFLLNYNQVVVKCQILQECFLQNFNMQNFQNMYHSNSRTFQELSRTSQGPYEPCTLHYHQKNK